MKKTLLIGCICTFLLAWKFQPIELEKQSILDNKVEILLPKGFGLMSEDMLNLKYPAKSRPTLVYTNERASINVGFNHTSGKATQQQMEAYKDYLTSTMKSTFPSAEWKGSGVKQINGRKVGYLEFISQASDTKIYNLMFFTNLEGRLLLCTFNCTIKNKDAWLASAKEIMHSLTIK